MNRIEWEESDADEDGDVSISFGIISNDPRMLARVRRALRMIVSESDPDLNIVSDLKGR